MSASKKSWDELATLTFLKLHSSVPHKGSIFKETLKEVVMQYSVCFSKNNFQLDTWSNSCVFTRFFVVALELISSSVVYRAASHFSGVVFLSRRWVWWRRGYPGVSSLVLTQQRGRGHKNYLAEGVKKELSWQFVNGQQWICSTFTGGSWIELRNFPF